MSGRQFLDNTDALTTNTGLLSHISELGLPLDGNYDEYEKYLIGNFIIPDRFKVRDINTSNEENFKNYITDKIDYTNEDKFKKWLSDSTTTSVHNNSGDAFLLNNLGTQQGLHLPGHNWLGPGTDVHGNLIRNVQPTDLDDQIAMKHDLAYAKAKTREDIMDADAIMVAALHQARLAGRIDDQFGATLAEYVIAGKAAIDRVTNKLGFITYGDPTPYVPMVNQDL